MRPGFHPYHKPATPLAVVSAILLAVLCAASVAGAHDSSVTKVRVSLSGDAVKATLDLNASDVLSFVMDVHDRHEFLDEAEVAEARERAVEYVRRHAELRIDGKLAAPADLPSQPATQSAAASTNLPMTLQWPVPAGSRKLTLTLLLFESPGFDAIFEVTADRAAQPQYLHAGDTITLDVPTAVAMPAPAAPPSRVETAAQFLRLGFTHIVPEGLDHILFVVGLFFLSPRLKPLLTQVTAFTVAHSITLALSVLGYVSLPSRIVEPVIALSITAVALENIFTRKVHPWRWAVVFGFGLVHGLGFAGILHETSLPPGGIAAALVSFNVGVELGQLAVIAVLLALTYWMRDRAWYFSRVAAPVSILIAAVGLFWTVQRVLNV